METLFSVALAIVIVLSVVLLVALTLMLLIDLYHEVKRW